MLLAAWARPAAGQSLTKQDSINQGLQYLLEDRRTRYETTDVINAMYNFKYDQADQEYRYLEAKYPGHPLPTFLRGLLVWWKMLPDPENRSNDGEFLAHMAGTISKAEQLLERNEKNLEAAFFLAGAYGFRGRYHAEQKNWRKAALDGKAALKYLEMSHGQEQFSPEFLFGDGLFNYYREYISENYVMLRPLMAFFPKGSKQLGLDQLKRVTQTAFYTRTEAQTYLMRIYANEEGKAELAYPLAEYLANKFPDNSYYQRYHARMAYVTGRNSDCRRVAQDMYIKYKAAMPGYTSETMRNAAYFLGYTTWMRASTDTAKRTALRFFTEAVQAAEQAKAMESGYTISAMYFAGLASHQLGDAPAAIAWMERAVDNADKDNYAGKDARAWLEKNAPRKKRFWLF